MDFSIFNKSGERKYLTKIEIDKFLKSSRKKSEDIHLFCWFLASSGCRISEALSLVPENLDFEGEQVIVRCLKKRDVVFRAVPLPSNLLSGLKRWISRERFIDERIWPWSRMTGYRRVIEAMADAKIRGSYATPKGLRHGFAVRAIQANVPLNLVQRWLGHADMKTTAIYANATGPEEREIAARLWRPMLNDPVTHRMEIGSSEANEAISKLISGGIALLSLARGGANVGSEAAMSSLIEIIDQILPR